MLDDDRYDDTYDEPPVDGVQLRVQSLVYAGVAYAYGSRYPLPRHADWDDEPEAAA